MQRTDSYQNAPGSVHISLCFRTFSLKICYFCIAIIVLYFHGKRPTFGLQPREYPWDSSRSATCQRVCDPAVWCPVSQTHKASRGEVGRLPLPRLRTCFEQRKVVVNRSDASYNASVFCFFFVVFLLIAARKGEEGGGIQRCETTGQQFVLNAHHDPEHDINLITHFLVLIFFHIAKAWTHLTFQMVSGLMLSKASLCFEGRAALRLTRAPCPRLSASVASMWWGFGAKAHTTCNLCY